MQQRPQVVLLEVGLGGRLDAVNVMDPDIAVITSIGLDHQEWLGNDRESIGFEKAGIMRAGIPCVIGEPEPPASLQQVASGLGVAPAWQGKNFTFHQQGECWQWRSDHHFIDGLPLPAIPLQNASTAMAVAEQLGWSINQDGWCSIITATQLPGRFQRTSKDPRLVLDVAHNPQATGYLAKRLKEQDFANLYLVVAMLGDKDIASSLVPLQSLSPVWLPASLDVPRGASCDTVAAALVGQDVAGQYDSVISGYQSASKLATEQDLIVVFGSFFTVAEITGHLQDLGE